MQRLPTRPAFVGISRVCCERIRQNKTSNDMPAGESFMHTGRCFCDAINYEITGALGAAYYCHCSRCRKISGSAFTANAVVAPDRFVVTRGEALLKSFTTADGIRRTFCSNCGTHLFVSQGDQMRLRLGTLDGPLNTPMQMQMHIFTASKAEWYEILDDLPQHAERPVV